MECWQDSFLCGQQLLSGTLVEQLLSIIPLWFNESDLPASLAFYNILTPEVDLLVKA